MSTEELRKAIQKEAATIENEDLLQKALQFMKALQPLKDDSQVHPLLDEAYEKITSDNHELLKKLAE